MKSLRELRTQNEFSEVAQKVLEVLDRHTDYLSAQLVPLALGDKSLPSEEREDLARALHRELQHWQGEEFTLSEVERPGPKLASGDAYFLDGRTPRLSEFVTPSSFLIFKVIDQQPEDLEWLGCPSEEWEASDAYQDFQYFVKHKKVVNDPAERAIGLIKPLVANFKKEEHLQNSLKTMEEVRSRYPKGKNWKGEPKTSKNKQELQKFKPSDMMRNILNESGSDDSDDDLARPPPRDALVL